MLISICMVIRHHATDIILCRIKKINSTSTSLFIIRPRRFGNHLVIKLEYAFMTRLVLLC